MRKQAQYKVYCNVKPRPRPHEISAAQLVANFMRADVWFHDPDDVLKEPDLIINNQRWEMKSPEGSKEDGIEKQFQRASQQAINMILDSRRSKLHPEKIRRLALYQFGKSKYIKRTIFISKDGIVEEFKAHKKRRR